MVITRFAPSPTGYLHIGSARTALFNYLFAKHHNGHFLLRIEDTDAERNNPAALKAIFDGLKWLGLNWDREVIYQSERQNLYKQAAKQLLEQGKAYYCYSTQEEIDKQRQHALQNKLPFIFKSPWRDADNKDYPQGRNPVVRLKAPREGNTIIHDQLQGDVVVPNSSLDDMVLLRSNSTATYMLAVVYDDHAMKITHIIRGDDHLTNAARQILLYNSLGWKIPEMVHIPLIHGMDGAKLSKRHGALGVEHYKNTGYLPEALCNYLLRLGWGHGDNEIISKEQAIKWFDISGLGKAPAKLDADKMRYLNAHYLRNIDKQELVNMIIEGLKPDYIVNSKEKQYIINGLEEMQKRCELLAELVELAKIYLVNHDFTYSPEALEVIRNCNQEVIKEVINTLKKQQVFDKQHIQEALKSFANRHNIKLPELMQPIRALMTGSLHSPSIFEIMAIIGLNNTINRLQKNEVIL